MQSSAGVRCCACRIGQHTQISPLEFSCPTSISFLSGNHLQICLTTPPRVICKCQTRQRLAVRPCLCDGLLVLMPQLYNCKGCFGEAPGGFCCKCEVVLAESTKAAFQTAQGFSRDNELLLCSLLNLPSSFNTGEIASQHQ